MHLKLNAWVISENIKFPSVQQNALQESIFNNIEQTSKVYVAILDTKKTFGTVWLQGVFYKLFKLEFTGKMWTLPVNAHTDMASCVQVNGIRSGSFPVRQGIRQGGVISTWIYNLFIDELLNNLEQSGQITTDYCF